jgi:4, uracil-DNA glycosylase family
MLSSRYLHLHQALGLGPMWLNRHAKVIPPAGDAPVTQPQKPAAAQVAEAVRTISASAHHARMAAMAAVQHEKTASATTPPIPPSDAPVDAPSPSARTHSVPENTGKASASTVSDDLPRLQTEARPSEVIIISICPATEDSLHGQLFHGAVGVLLDNMLTAIRLTPQQAYKTSWVKAAPVFSPHPTDEQIQAELPQLAQELADTQAKAVLLVGQIFEKPELAPLIDTLCGNTPRFILPHPARLLRQPQLKAKAWQVLKQVRQILN